MARCGIEPQGQQVDGRVQRVLPELAGVADGGQGVQVGDEVEGVFGPVLQFDVLPDGAEVVAPMEAARGLNAGQYTRMMIFIRREGRVAVRSRRADHFGHRRGAQLGQGGRQGV